MLKKLLLTAALGASLLAQHDASLNINSDDLEVQGNIDLGMMNETGGYDTHFLTLGFLDVDNRQSTDPLLSVGFKIRQDVMAVQGLRFGLGLKGTYTRVGNARHAAVPIGIEAAYTLPINTGIPVVVTAALDYAPSVLNFKDADSYTEKRLEVGVKIIEQATVYLGYRNIDTDFENGGDYGYNDEVYVGFRVQF